MVITGRTKPSSIILSLLTLTVFLMFLKHECLLEARGLIAQRCLTAFPPTVCTGICFYQRSHLVVFSPFSSWESEILSVFLCLTFALSFPFLFRKTWNIVHWVLTTTTSLNISLHYNFQGGGRGIFTPCPKQSSCKKCKYF